MKPEEIEYIREWAAGGNEPRPVGKIPSVLMWCGREPRRGFWALSDSGLTIAAQAERIRELELAFAQACETAEKCGSYISDYYLNIDRDLDTMRANRERLLK